MSQLQGRSEKCNSKVEKWATQHLLPKQYISRKMLMKDLGLKMYDILKLIKYITKNILRQNYIANARF